MFARHVVVTIRTKADLTVAWLHRGEAAADSLLEQAVQTVEWPAGRVSGPAATSDGMVAMPFTGVRAD